MADSDAGRSGNLAELAFDTLAIVHHTRGGSTVLERLLNTMPGVCHAGEVFNWASEWDRRLGEAGRWALDDGAGHQAADAVGFIARVGATCRLLKPDAQIFMFELTSWDFARGVLAGGLGPLLGAAAGGPLGRLGVVHLIRRNALRRYVSSEVARSRGVYHSSTRPASPSRICLDPKRALADVMTVTRGYDDWGRLLMQVTGGRMLSLTYEDHVMRDPCVGLACILNFIGAPSPQPPEFTPDLKAATARQNDFPLSEVVQNHAEVERLFRQTDYAWMLSD